MCQAWLGPKASGFGLAYSGFGLKIVEARPEAGLGGKPKPWPGFDLNLGLSSYISRLHQEYFNVVSHLIHLFIAFQVAIEIN